MFTKRELVSVMRRRGCNCKIPVLHIRMMEDAERVLTCHEAGVRYYFYLRRT